MKHFIHYFSRVALLAIMVFLVGCDGEIGGLEITSSKNLTLNYDETSQIIVSGASSNGIVYESEDEYHARVTEGGMITGRCVGNTVVEIRDGHKTAEVAVKVVARENLYETPTLAFGIVSKSDIISLYGTPDEETDDVLAYKNYSPSADVLMFNFDERGKLESSLVAVKISYTSNLVDFLLERYIPVHVEATSALFIDGLTLEEANTTIMLNMFNTSYMSVVYMDAEISSGVSPQKIIKEIGNSNTMNKMLERLEK